MQRSHEAAAAERPRRKESRCGEAGERHSPTLGISPAGYQKRCAPPAKPGNLRAASGTGRVTRLHMGTGLTPLGPMVGSADHPSTQPGLLGLATAPGTMCDVPVAPRLGRKRTLGVVAAPVKPRGVAQVAEERRVGGAATRAALRGHGISPEVRKKTAKPTIGGETLTSLDVFACAYTKAQSMGSAQYSNSARPAQAGSADVLASRPLPKPGSDAGFELHSVGKSCGGTSCHLSFEKDTSYGSIAQQDCVEMYGATPTTADVDDSHQTAELLEESTTAASPEAAKSTLFFAHYTPDPSGSRTQIDAKSQESATLLHKHCRTCEHRCGTADIGAHPLSQSAPSFTSASSSSPWPRSRDAPAGGKNAREGIESPVHVDAGHKPSDSVDSGSVEEMCSCPTPTTLLTASGATSQSPSCTRRPKGQLRALLKQFSIHRTARDAKTPQGEGEVELESAITQKGDAKSRPQSHRRSCQTHSGVGDGPLMCHTRKQHSSSANPAVPDAEGSPQRAPSSIAHVGVEPEARLAAAGRRPSQVLRRRSLPSATVLEPPQVINTPLYSRHTAYMSSASRLASPTPGENGALMRSIAPALGSRRRRSLSRSGADAKVPEQLAALLGISAPHRVSRTMSCKERDSRKQPSGTESTSVSAATRRERLAARVDQSQRTVLCWYSVPRDPLGETLSGELAKPPLAPCSRAAGLAPARDSGPDVVAEGKKGKSCASGGGSDTEADGGTQDNAGGAGDGDPPANGDGKGNPSGPGAGGAASGDDQGAGDGGNGDPNDGGGADGSGDGGDDDSSWEYIPPPNNQRTFFFPEDNISFSSEFDSGNLIQVERVGPLRYNMWSCQDCGNTSYQTNNRQWFHFAVRGGTKGSMVSITFIGMMHSLMFTYGWSPVISVSPHSKGEYSRLPGKAVVVSLDEMPATPGYPLLVQKTWPKLAKRAVAKAAEDSARSPGEGNCCSSNASSPTTINPRPVSQIASPTAPCPPAVATTATSAGAPAALPAEPVGASESVLSFAGPTTAKRTKKKEPSVAMNLSFEFRIDVDTPLTSPHELGHPSCHAIYIASNHPYSYSTLQRNICHWEEHAAGASASPSEAKVTGNGGGSPTYFHREVLCETLDGRKVDLLTITDKSGVSQEREPMFSDADGIPVSSSRGDTQRPLSFPGKQYVVLSARVHPGECPASHIMHGCIEFLLRRNDPRAAALRSNFVFIVVPMINPDGVVRGHSRTDTCGVNLNRMYRTPSKRRHPAPYSIRAMLRALAATSRLALFIDMHAHANRKGTFFYGNAMRAENQVQNLLYTKLVSLNTPYFDFLLCNLSESNMYAVGKSGEGKDTSSRVTIFQDTGLIHSYTIEASHVAGNSMNPILGLSGVPGEELDILPGVPCPKYSPATFASTGHGLLVALLDMVEMNPMSRLPMTQYQTVRGVASWLYRQLHIELAEMLFKQAFSNGGQAQLLKQSGSSTPAESLATVLSVLRVQDIPDVMTIRDSRDIPPTTVKRTGLFTNPELVGEVLAQVPPHGPPRSLICGSKRASSVRRTAQLSPAGRAAAASTAGAPPRRKSSAKATGKKDD